MKKFLLKNWELIAVLILSLLTAWPLFRPGYFSHHDDLQVIRVFEMRKCFGDLQIPCRWVPDMGYGNGYPLFNFYSATPYYIGAILSYVVGYIWAVKILFVIPIILGGVAMYLLGKELFGKSGGVVASFLYILVPYRALDTYVRGALAESFALGVIPFIFYFSHKLVNQKKLTSFWGLTLSLFVLLTSHNIMTLLFLPLIGIWISYLLVLKRFSNLKTIALAMGLGFGLSSFFLVPAFVEKSLVTTETLTQGHLDYRVHFVSLAQFFERSWGYGSSVMGTGDGISFQIGLPYLLFVPLSLLLFILRYKKISKSSKFLIIFLIVIFGISMFMAHGKSWFIWEAVSILKYVQFPWRFLALISFATSLLGGAFIWLVSYYPKVTKSLFPIIILILILAIVLNFGYFKPQTFYFDITDEAKLSGEMWEEQQKGAILDYLPKTASEPFEKAPDAPIIKKGKAEVLKFINKSNRWELDIKVLDDATMEIPVFDFPAWQVKVGDNNYPHKAGTIGRITFDLPKGNYHVTGVFQDTPVRTISNLLTTLSLVGLVVITLYGKIKRSLAK